MTLSQEGAAMLNPKIESYRFGTGKEPTDAMLEQIMHEVAQEARKSSQEVTKFYFERMRRNIAEKKMRWKERINRACR